MFEGKTFEVILEDMLSRIPSTLDKREGSVIYDALAPVAAELAQIYAEMDAVLDETFADTASINYLSRRVVERGLTRILATKAIMKGEFTPTSLEIPIGTRFSCDQLNYAVTEKISAGTYKLECETAGSDGNNHLGQLIPIDYITGLETATITEVLVPAREDETADELRERYFETMTSQSYGGNVADYKEKTKSVEGYPVAACKITPVWNGGGTVKVTILDGEYNAPSQALIDAIQNALDPVGHSGQGYGLAPIGHVVTVDGGTDVTVNITATITYVSGWSWASAGDYIKAAVDKYFEQLAETWENESALVVRLAMVDAAILSAEGVLDVSGTRLNGSAANLNLTSSQIPLRGTINGNQ